MNTLNFQITLTNLESLEFTTEGEEEIGKILNQFHSSKVFSQSSLVLDSGNSLVVYPAHLIAEITLKLDVNTELFRKFDFLRDGSQKREITKAEWLTGIDELSQHQSDRWGILGKEGGTVKTFGQIQLLNGKTIYMSYDYDQNLPNAIEQRRFFQVVFTLPGFSYIPLGGGISILNPTQIAKCLFHPGGEPPTTAWKVQNSDFVN